MNQKENEKNDCGNDGHDDGDETPASRRRNRDAETMTVMMTGAVAVLERLVVAGVVASPKKKKDKSGDAMMKDGKRRLGLCRGR